MGFKDFSEEVISDLRFQRYTSITKGRDSIDTFKGGEPSESGNHICEHPLLARGTWNV